MLKLRFLDLSFRTAYAQAKELALAQSEIPLLTPGTVRVEERSGRQFAYRYRYDATGKRITEYLGAMSDSATTGRIEHAHEEIKDFKTIAQYSLQLRKIGFYSADNSTLVTVASLFNSGIFGGGGMLIGTHAFGAIMNELGVSASPFPMTEDLDVARTRRIELAAVPKGGLLDLLKSTGLPFHEVPSLKRGAQATSFKVRGRKLKVDLLVPTTKAPYKPVAVKELGAHALGLPHLDYLLKESIPSVLIGRDRIVPIAVPNPGLFCLHKLAMFSLRPSADSSKREKDVLQAAALAAALMNEEDFRLAEAIDGINTAIRKRIRPGAKQAAKVLTDNYPEAAEIVATLA
ncbi:MAG: hypothetical protein GTO40_14800 [Deltaproteobacteria bacterium]|nr:hypothetical protein [Deltaproteobacteria bacterium]